MTDYKQKIIDLMGQDVVVFKTHPDVEQILKQMDTIDVSIVDSRVNAMGWGLPTRQHLRGLYRLSKCLNLNYILELGVRDAGSTRIFLDAISDDGRLVSFDPQFFPNACFNGQDSRWTYHACLDYDGYAHYKDLYVAFDALFIDTHDHTYIQLYDQLRNWWVKNIKFGGYIICDDCAPQHQEETRGIRPPDMHQAMAHYGILHGLLEFIDEYNEQIDYAFSFDNNTANGILAIKLKD